MLNTTLYNYDLLSINLDIPLTNSIIISLAFIDISFLGCLTGITSNTEPYLPFQSPSNHSLPIPCPIADSAGQFVTDLSLTPSSSIRKLYWHAFKSDSLSYFLCYLISPNLRHLCLNYCNSLTCGFFAASTFVSIICSRFRSQTNF